MAESLQVELTFVASSTLPLRAVSGPPEPAPANVHVKLGETLFLDGNERARRCSALEAEGYLRVSLESISANARGRLADIIDEAIERELIRQGAAASGIGSPSDPDAALCDHLYRARHAGARGLVLSIGPLHAAAVAVGAFEDAFAPTTRGGMRLDAEDSRTLLFWSEATRERPVVLLLDPENGALGAYGDPIPLTALLDGTHDHSTRTQIAMSKPAIHESEIEPTNANANDIADAIPARQRAGASVAMPEDTWRGWVLALAAARGRQPLNATERLFTQNYMPLANAIADGLDDPRALQAYDEFRHNFVKAYTEACPTFAVTGKRPKMVFDAPEIAARLARLHGARSAHVLMVDGLRFDLGVMMKDALVSALGSRAILTDEGMLWSALPSTTSHQMDMLARGMDAFRTPLDSEREHDPLRGRLAETIRRIKVGHRDLYKLDVVESRLGELAASGVDSADFPAIAEAAAEPIARHAVTLPARTLLFVFGDHGFSVDRSGKVSRGGASPEEVLVPTFAFLVGSIH